MIPGPEMILGREMPSPDWTANDFPDRLTMNIKWNELKFGQWISTLYTSFFS